MQFAVTGVTVSGNMGGTAMLAAAVDQLSKLDKDAQFSLLSISPEKDRERPFSGVRIVSAKPVQLLLLYLPITLLVWPFARSGFVRRLLVKNAYFRALIEADIVIDLCGIAFVDGRGLPLLVYNIACCLPAIILGTPVAKLSQALGPFETQPNRMFARFILQRCSVLVARGDRSLEFLRKIGLHEAISLPDTSFAMEVTDRHIETAKQMLPRFSDDTKMLIVSPSEVVRRLCERKGIKFEEEFSNFLKARISKGYSVVFVPHSFGAGRSKNNDVDLCRTISASLQPERVTMIEPIEDPRVLRALIGMADAFVGCRFHSVVAALAMNVPSLVVGWSHKYQEMMAMLQPGEWFIDAGEFSSERLEGLFERFEKELPQLHEAIAQNLPDVRARAKHNFELAVRLKPQ